MGVPVKGSWRIPVEDPGKACGEGRIRKAEGARGVWPPALWTPTTLVHSTNTSAID